MMSSNDLSTRFTLLTDKLTNHELLMLYYPPLLKAKRWNLIPTFLLFQAQEACGPLEIDNALTVVRGLEKDIQEAKASAAEGKLRPLPGETVSTHPALAV